MRHLSSSLLLGLLTLLIIQPITLAHQSGCHRWHSCPSDTGSYNCGDLEYCSECPDNEYCKDGEPRVFAQSIKSSIPSSSSAQNQTPQQTNLTTPTTEEQNCHPSYPTVCIPPPPPDLDCINVAYNDFEVFPPDPHRFDGDQDGIGCEKTFAPSATPQITIESGKITEINVTIPVECKKTFKGIIKNIINGDTLVIDGCDERIQLSLVNTSDYSYEFGYAKTKSFVENLCKVGSVAIIDQDDLQPFYYGERETRIIAAVYCQNKSLNAELIYNKLGKIDTRFCSTSEFANETWAKDYGCETKQNTPVQEVPKTGQVTKVEPNVQPSQKSFIDIFVDFLASFFSLFKI